MSHKIRKIEYKPLTKEGRYNATIENVQFKDFDEREYVIVDFRPEKNGRLYELASLWNSPCYKSYDPLARLLEIVAPDLGDKDEFDLEEELSPRLRGQKVGIEIEFNPKNGKRYCNAVNFFKISDEPADFPAEVEAKKKKKKKGKKAKDSASTRKSDGFLIDEDGEDDLSNL